MTSSPLRHLGDGARARVRPATAQALPADTGVPALIVKIGRYPLHHGGVGAIRTLGRLGVPVYAITEDAFTPAALSRYCRRSFVWPTTGQESPGQLVDGLLAIGAEIGRPTVAVPTDEEAAVLLAEHASQLSGQFLLPAVPPELPRRLASKQGLYEFCVEHGVPAPASVSPLTDAELISFARQATFPLVAKNREAWVRRSAPVVAGTTVFGSEQELLATARDWGTRPSVILQEYIPREAAQDWIVHLYCDANSNCMVEFTGIKIRSWPPHAGMTACARTLPNPALAEEAARLCKAIGFSGIADLDWRLDLRDGQYKLLDFNPRVGAQFRLFETEAGVDVVRALHLDLTGRGVPASQRVNARKLIVENIDPLAKLSYRGQAAPLAQRPGPVPSGQLLSGHGPSGQPPLGHGPSGQVPAGVQPLWGMRAGVQGLGEAPPGVPAEPSSHRTELAWIAPDDPLPFFAMSVRLAGPALGYVARLWRSRKLRRQAARAARGDTAARSPEPGPVAGAAPVAAAAAVAAASPIGSARPAAATSHVAPAARADPASPAGLAPATPAGPMTPGPAPGRSQRRPCPP